MLTSIKISNYIFLFAVIYVKEFFLKPYGTGKEAWECKTLVERLFFWPSLN